MAIDRAEIAEWLKDNCPRELRMPGRGEEDIPQEQHNVGLRVAMSPIGRLGKASDAGALCVYLASPEAMFMTGQTIPLNGGGVGS